MGSDNYRNEPVYDLNFLFIAKQKSRPIKSRLSVLEAGLEPARPRWPLDFKSNVSTNSTTRALCQRKTRFPLVGISGFMSGKRDSNSRPRPWQGRALPTELFPHQKINFRRIFEAANVKHFSNYKQIF